MLSLSGRGTEVSPSPEMPGRPLQDLGLVLQQLCCITKITLIIANLITSFSCLPWKSHSEVWWLTLSGLSSRGLGMCAADGVAPVNVTGLHSPRPGETEQKLTHACSRQLVVSRWEESSKGRPGLNSEEGPISLLCTAELPFTYRVIC